MRNGKVGASPQKNDATVKPVTEVISRRLRPKRPASQPVIGRMIALATRYEVSVQVASSLLLERLPAMCGSETLTTVVSSTSMKVLDMTAVAISHGLISRCSWFEPNAIQFVSIPKSAHNVILLSFHVASASRHRKLRAHFLA